MDEELLKQVIPRLKSLIENTYAVLEHFRKIGAPADQYELAASAWLDATYLHARIRAAGGYEAIRIENANQS
jgi:hypothetical protein